MNSRVKPTRIRFFCLDCKREWNGGPLCSIHIDVTGSVEVSTSLSRTMAPVKARMRRPNRTVYAPIVLGISHRDWQPGSNLDDGQRKGWYR